jgi:hypothetical protein
MRFGFLAMVKMSMLIIRFVTQCGFAGKFPRFGGTHIHLQG